MKEKTLERTRIEVVDKTIETLPKTEIECPRCNHGKAFYWTAQTSHQTKQKPSSSDAQNAATSGDRTINWLLQHNNLL